MKQELVLQVRAWQLRVGGHASKQVDRRLGTGSVGGHARLTLDKLALDQRDDLLVTDVLARW